MNESKRTLLSACAHIIEEVRNMEQQDLEDQPDEIENSEACADFRANIQDLDYVNYMLDRVVLRSDDG